jgi:hypothetical protein
VVAAVWRFMSQAQLTRSDKPSNGFVLQIDPTEKSFKWLRRHLDLLEEEVGPEEPRALEPR